MRTLFLLIVFSLSTGPLSAAPPSSGEILEQIRLLGDEGFAVRREAFEKLKQWAEAYPRHVLQQMAEAYRDTKDMEITIRLEELMQPLAEKLFLIQPPGFIGINMMWRDSGTVGVEVSGVLAGHAAQRAGIQEGDVIVELNGESVARMEALDGFAGRVAGYPPGTLVVLKIDRGGRMVDIPLQLGARPEHLQGMQVSRVDLQDRYEAWLRELAQMSGDFDPDFPVGHFPME